MNRDAEEMTIHISTENGCTHGDMGMNCLVSAVVTPVLLSKVQPTPETSRLQVYSPCSVVSKMRYLFPNLGSLC